VDVGRRKFAKHHGGNNYFEESPGVLAVLDTIVSD
jgi:hypothetical protein